jgi:hypothetical protein
MQSLTPAGGKPVTPERLMQFAFGYAAPLMIEAAVRHRVFDLLDGGPKTIDQISKESGASVRGLRGIMNALVGLEFLAKEGDHYKLTPESAAFLVSSKPAFLGGLIKHTSGQLLPKWMQRSERCEFRYRAQHRYARAHSAQRRSRAKQGADQEDLRRAGARRDDRDCGVCAERRTHRPTGTVDFRGEYAGEHRSGRHVHVQRNQ